MSVQFNNDGTVKITDEVKALAAEKHLLIQDAEFTLTDPTDKEKKHTIAYKSVEALTGKGSAFLCGNQMEVSEAERAARGKRGRQADGEEDIQKSVLGHFFNSYEGSIRAKLRAAKLRELEGPEKALEASALKLSKQFTNLTKDQILEMLKTNPLFQSQA